MKVAIEIDSLPVSLRFGKPMSDDELLLFCAENDLLRIERESTGEIVMMSPSGAGTSVINADIVYELKSWSRSIGRGFVFDSNAGFTLADGSMRSPDASWLESRKWEVLSKKEQAGFARVCPDFVIELRSPSDRLDELRKKMELWIANGAELGWLIDPLERRVHVYRADATTGIYEDPSSVQGCGCMAGFELVMSRVWA